MTDYIFISDEDYRRAGENGISKHLLYGRVQVGAWDLERAITQPVRRRFCCDKVVEIAKEHGISIDLLRRRVRKGNLSPYQASIKPVQPTARKKIK